MAFVTIILTHYLARVIVEIVRKFLEAGRPMLRYRQYHLGPPHAGAATLLNKILQVLLLLLIMIIIKALLPKLTKINGVLIPKLHPQKKQ